MIVTGASSGIGEAAARAFGHKDAKVVLVARRVEKLRTLAHEINSSGAETLVVQADLSKLVEIQALVTRTLEKFERIDVLVNNAGFGRMDWLEKLDPVKDIQEQIDMNVLSVIQTTRQVLPVMLKQRSGSIVNMCSISGLIATPTYSIYAASKHAVHGFSEALRREVKPLGIDVSIIYPGGVLDTEFAQNATFKRTTNTSTPKFMQLTTEQVGDAIIKLVRNPRRMLIIPWQWRVTVFLNKLFPGLVDHTTISQFTIPERKEELNS